MPRVNPLINSFIGEVGPRTLARVDFDRYPNTAETVENMVTVPQGGMFRRAGTRYIAETKTSANNSYLLDFQYNVEQSYVIEGGASYFRFYRDQGQITIGDTDAAITNGAFASDVASWTDQSGAGSSISHNGTLNAMNLTSNGTTNAHAEQAVTVGASYQSIVHALQFRVLGVPGDFISVQIGTSSTGTELLDREVGVGYHVISFTPGVGTIYVQFVHKARNKAVQIDDVAFIDDSALELVTPYTAAQIQTMSHPQTNDVMYCFVGGTVPVYKLLRYGHTDWSLEEVEFLDGPYLDQNMDNILDKSATVGLGVKRSQSAGSSTTLSPAATSGLGVTLTASAVDGINDGRGFLSTDVGRLVRIQQSDAAERGYGIITAVATTTSATIDIRETFNATTATTRWWLGAFSATTGYPSVGTFHEQRLVCSNITDFPQSIMLSQSGDIENMRPDSFVSGALTIQDDDAMNYTLASTKSNVIRWVESARELMLGTSGGEWVITSSGAVLTPTDFNALRRTQTGSANVQPVVINDAICFVQRAKQKLYDYGFEFDIDGFRARELTQLAHRVSGGGITQIAYAQEPDGMIWCVLEDGKLATLTYRPDEDRFAWSRQILGGTSVSVESIAIIPGEDGGGRTLDSGDRDEVWVLVKRTIDGATERYIEIFEKIFEGPLRHDHATEALWETQMLTDQKDAFYIDSGLTYDGAATTTITGLDHLEGETVKVLADGGIHPDKTVASGSITLDYSASKVQVGLGYTHTYKSPKLNFGAAAGTAVGKMKRVNEVTAVLLDSATFKIGTSLTDLIDVEFRTVDDLMDTAVPLFAGEKVIPFNGVYDTDARIFIQSDTPSAFAMLALAPEMKTNDQK